MISRRDILKGAAAAGLWAAGRARLHARPQATAPAGESLVPYVDPFIGTGGLGHTFPGATVPGGLVQVSTRPASPNEAEVIVADQGIGIPAEKLPRIFEDYYRTDEAVKHNRSSTGLGLAVVRQVAREMRAAIQVESTPGWGTRFTVRLPAAPARGS